MIVAGVMSGTSLDGIDAVAVDFADDGGMRVVGQASCQCHPSFAANYLRLLLALTMKLNAWVMRLLHSRIFMRGRSKICSNGLASLLLQPVFTVKLFAIARNAALRCSSITLHLLPNSPALTSLPTSAHAMLPPVAKAHRSCRPFMLPAFAAPSAVQQYSISAVSLTSH